MVVMLTLERNLGLVYGNASVSFLAEGLINGVLKFQIVIHIHFWGFRLLISFYLRVKYLVYTQRRVTGMFFLVAWFEKKGLSAQGVNI